MKDVKFCTAELMFFFLFLLVEFIYACIPKINFPCCLEEPKKFVWWWVGGGGVESESSDRLWPRPSQTIECLIDQSPNNQAIHKF